MDRGDAVGSRDEQRHCVEAVGHHIDAPDDLLLPEEDRLQRLRAAGRLHDDVGRLAEVAACRTLRSSPRRLRRKPSEHERRCLLSTHPPRRHRARRSRPGRHRLRRTAADRRRARRAAGDGLPRGLEHGGLPRSGGEQPSLRSARSACRRRATARASASSTSRQTPMISFVTARNA